jgi:hypothetical protein
MDKKSCYPFPVDWDSSFQQPHADSLHYPIQDDAEAKSDLYTIPSAARSDLLSSEAGAKGDLSASEAAARSEIKLTGSEAVAALDTQFREDSKIFLYHSTETF